MSLEQKIEDLTEAVATLTATLKGAKVTKNIDNDDGDDAGDAGDDKRGKRKRRTKAEIEADKKANAKKQDDDGDDGDGDDDGDDFGDDDGDDFGDDDNTKITADSIRELLMRVKDEKGADKARGILSELGVKAIAQIPEKQYPKVVALAKKLGVK